MRRRHTSALGQPVHQAAEGSQSQEGGCGQQSRYHPQKRGRETHPLAIESSGPINWDSNSLPVGTSGSTPPPLAGLLLIANDSITKHLHYCLPGGERLGRALGEVGRLDFLLLKRRSWKRKQSEEKNKAVTPLMQRAP